MKTLLLGGPGAGKTERLLAVMQSALERGIPPNQIAYCAFTNVASDEARQRAMKKFGFNEDDLPYCRTLHSLCFRELGLQRGQILQKEHLDEISSLTGELTPTLDLNMDAPAQGVGADPLLTVDHFSRTTLRTLEEGWRVHGRELDWFRLKRFTSAYSLYKQDTGLMDFTDLLTEYLAMGAPVPVRVAIIDEAQDLTHLQWAVIEKAFGHCEELWAGGDDDQSCFRWAGAAEDHLLNLGYQREILPLSHRLPRSIFRLSQEIVARISTRYAKAQKPSPREGLVNWVNRPEEVALASGTWLMLARTRFQLKSMIETARNQGVIYSVLGVSSVDENHVRAIQAYEKLRAGNAIDGSDAHLVLKMLGMKHKTSLNEEELYGAGELKIKPIAIWHDALVKIPLDDRLYYVACMRRGEKLTNAPRVRIQTIHGAKGMEAENVMLSTDLTARTYKGYELDPDSEHRVMFVGVTRASKELHLIAPQTQYGYPL